MNKLSLPASGFTDPLVATLLRLVDMDGLCGQVATYHFHELDNHARYGYSFEGGRV